MGEDDFIRAIVADPKDNAQLLVYSDWLEDQADPASTAKAEFLRLTVTEPKGKGGKKKREGRLQELAANLATDWLAVVSRLQLENCSQKREEGDRKRIGPLRFEFVCDRRWEDLRATDDGTVRYCEGCAKNVHYCDTITAARDHAEQGLCVAVDLGVLRREGDLAPPMLTMGLISPSAIRREQELLKPDPVSAERERRKREATQKA
jgi:uncharacterized protein (TIGR02996 family)